MEELAKDNLNLIYFALKQLNLYNKDGIDDYFDLGLIGLVKGLKTYSENKGAISTYLISCIKNEITMELRNQKAAKRNNGVKPISINTPTTDKLTIEDCLESNLNILEDAIKNEQVKELHTAITMLKPVEKRVIIDIYFKNKTQLEIAKELGFRQSYVSRIKTKAINKLRAWFDNKEKI